MTRTIYMRVSSSVPPMKTVRKPNQRFCSTNFCPNLMNDIKSFPNTYQYIFNNLSHLNNNNKITLVCYIFIKSLNEMNFLLCVGA